jgi:tetratricopeptide (TPR) repeat protein
MRLSFVSAAMFLLVATAVHAQSADDQVTAANRAYADQDVPAALALYEKALAVDPKNYEALWKGARAAIDLGTPVNDAARRKALYATAEQYARRAVAVNPGDADGHFVLAWALGKTALTQSARGRVKYGTEVRSHALECLRLRPGHAGCLHVMGVWNAEIMRLNGFVRLVARNILGGKVFGSASWPEAVRYMEAAVAAEPNRVVHRLDMGEIYRDVGDKTKARAQFETGLALPVTDYNDRRFKGEIQADLQRLGSA